MAVLRRKRKQVSWVQNGVLIDVVLNGKVKPLMLTPNLPTAAINAIPYNYRAAFVANKAIEKMMEAT